MAFVDEHEYGQKFRRDRFQDFYGFNLSLFGKHCWNFVNNPNSLVFGVFKSHYFPNTSLFSATRGGGVSFIWSGLWQAKEVLKKGFNWIIGDGKSIRDHEDPWFGEKDNYMVDDPYVIVDRVFKVRELFVPGEQRWESIKVYSQIVMLMLY